MTGRTIVLSGLAGSGKDTAADALCGWRAFGRVSLADPMKYLCGRVFGWDQPTLYGPSYQRNVVDCRFADINEVDAAWDRFDEVSRSFLETVGCPGEVASLGEWLYGLCRESLGLVTGVSPGMTPRRALQTLGTEWGRAVSPNLWIDVAVRRAAAANARGENVVVTDARFRNELEAFRAMRATLVRIVRPGAGLGACAAVHASESEMASIPDSSFDAVVNNAGTIEDLAESILRVDDVTSP